MNDKAQRDWLLAVLQATFQKGSRIDLDARWFFRVVMDVLTLETDEYLDLIWNIIKQMNPPLTSQEFQDLLHKTLPLFDANSDSVTRFYTSLLSTVLKPDMSYELLKVICRTNTLHPGLLELVKMLLPKLANSQFQAGSTELVWEFFFRTGHDALGDHLVTCCAMSRESRRVQSFLSRCDSHLDKVAVLRVIRSLIDFFEWRISEKNSPFLRNQFICPQDWIQVTFVGACKCSWTTLRDASYERVLGFVVAKTKGSRQQVVLKRNDVVLGPNN
jgi:hypothetical protein